MDKFFVNENQMEKWVDAAEKIEDEFGVEKAMGYLLGEKFYKIVEDIHFKQEVIRIMKITENVHQNLEIYREKKEFIEKARDILSEFVGLINQAFGKHKIRAYFDSNPRLGPIGHVSTEEEHAFMAEEGMVEHSVDTELEDALIFGEMREHFEAEK